MSSSTYDNPGPNAARCQCCEEWTFLRIVRHGAGKASEYNPTVFCGLCKGVVKQGSYEGDAR